MDNEDLKTLLDEATTETKKAYRNPGNRWFLDPQLQYIGHKSTWWFEVGNRIYYEHPDPATALRQGMIAWRKDRG